MDVESTAGWVTDRCKSWLELLHRRDGDEWKLNLRCSIVWRRPVWRHAQKNLQIHDQLMVTVSDQSRQSKGFLYYYDSDCDGHAYDGVSVLGPQHSSSMACISVRDDHQNSLGGNSNKWNECPSQKSRDESHG